MSASRGLRHIERHGLLRRGEPVPPEYRAWYQMIYRCTNERCRFWNNYGGRGIRVCDEWRKSFSAFLAHVGPRPTPKHTLDRIDNNGNYEPGNVRWATRLEQNRNTRRQERVRERERRAQCA